MFLSLSYSSPQYLCLDIYVFSVCQCTLKPHEISHIDISSLRPMAFVSASFYDMKEKDQEELMWLDDELQDFDKKRSGTCGLGVGSGE